MVVTLPFRPDVLQGRHALVCGGSAGIGAAIATTLASCGATVTSIARTEHSLDHLDGDGHQALVSDLEDLDALDDMLGRIHHPIHILINNTGGPHQGLSSKLIWQPSNLPSHGSLHAPTTSAGARPGDGGGGIRRDRQHRLDLRPGTHRQHRCLQHRTRCRCQLGEDTRH